ncbi:MAG TPA: SagB/ThcOx family dehydrogenase [Candidatus Ozemobacteraceae bacterium]|nr:SagB/ThcOx family dehydrogenase [Candidatus Ozemobacteraceae bacterium]
MKLSGEEVFPVGEAFLHETKYRRESMQSGFDMSARPAPFKEYSDKPNIQLPEPDAVKPSSLRQAIKNRRSVRKYTAKLVTLGHLSFLLWASCGARGRDAGILRRTVPSAGGLYPIETYVIVNLVEGLEPGVYHYAVRTHSLERLAGGNFGETLMHAALEQNQCREAPVVFVWSAIFARTTWKYGQRGYRYIYLDAGHIAHALAVSASSLGLGSCQMAAFFDDEVNGLIGLDGHSESVIYMTSVGRPG